MAYTRRQYVLMAVLAAGLAVLLVDRLFLHSADLPQKASAQSNSFQEEQAPAEPQGAVNLPEPRYSLAKKVQQYASRHDTGEQAPGDAFQPSDDWMAQLRKKPIELDGQQALAQGFMDRHHLFSTMCLPKQSTAIIDKQLLKVGDVLDGFRLESIKPTSVVFSRDGLNVVLNIAAAAKEE